MNPDNNHSGESLNTNETVCFMPFPAPGVATVWTTATGSH